jgi:hypothetical protein
MKGFILGILVTLAVLYPAVTKVILANTVDTTHQVVTNIMNNTQEAAK